ncbi:hypothetical protein NMY22_g188 [Coprinellus aureogranulatus]|nr:hypothetical protein NMY22_g188 [Coprinellus aureogranulatus]
MATVDIGATFGALMLGGLFALMLCGVTQAQAFLYFKLYPKDRIFLKSLVFSIWMLDTLHSAFIIVALWDHFIDHFGDAESIDTVPWSLGVRIASSFRCTMTLIRAVAVQLTIAITAILTFAVHCFLIYRIFALSRQSYLLCVPLLALSASRLAFACLTTAKLVSVELHSLKLFVRDFGWSFTAGLAISTILDIAITASLILLLKSRHQEFSTMNQILDALVLYTFETGGVTTVATGVCLITWLTMSDNLVFLALHFIISKFYANSLLMTLNTRANLKNASYQTHSSEPSRGNVPFNNNIGRNGNSAYLNMDEHDSSAKHRQRSVSRKMSRFSTHIDSVHVVDDRSKGDVSLDDLSEVKSHPGVQIRVNIDTATIVEREGP